jgi:hypothetical protein
MTAFATVDNLLSVDPTIQDFGVLDWDTELARSQTEITRVLSVRWWPTFRKTFGLSDIALINANLLDPTQWTQATVYHALAYHICPKLSKFEPDADRFQEMMKYYQGRFEHEMDLCIREGVRYDADENNTFSDAEKASDTSLRLRR